MQNNRFINDYSIDSSVAGNEYPFVSNGINYDNYNGCQSPCQSSTSSSKTRKKQKRTYYQSEDDSDYEVRKKPRHAILNESLKPENIEEVDTIEEVLDTRLGREGNTGDETTLYNQLYDPNTTKTGTERQYLIKWKNWSHVHATWESEASLKLRGQVEGMKKLDKYVFKFREMERYKNNCNSDELERLMFQEEQLRDSHYQKMQIDRIIHHQYDKNGKLEYFIKWNTLDYKYVTAESSESVVEPLFPKAIEQYQHNLKFLYTPGHSDYLRRRPVFKPIPNDLTFGNGLNEVFLRDYQQIGVNWLLQLWTVGRNAILADEMGLGKTIQTITFINVLFRRYKIYGPYLLIVPLSTINNWKKEFDLWAPDTYTVVYTGDKASREVIQKFEWFQPGTKNYKFNVILTTYEIVMNDKNLLNSIFWVFMGVDEAHRLKSNDSKLYKTIYPFHTNCRLLITGTPLQNNIKELWSLLHFIMPNIFNNFEPFQEKFGTGDNETLCNDRLASLRESIEQYILRREKKDVEKSLPAKSEQILRINMSKRQKELYRLILAKNFDSLLAQTNKRTIFKNVIVELKKCCNHIDLIGDKLSTIYDFNERLEYLIKSSGKMIVLDKLLTHLKSEGHRVLIFSQMVRMLDIIDVYLRMKNWGFQRLDGSISSNLRNEAIKSFNAPQSTDFCFLLSTRAGGLGINLTSADTVIIFDSDWNPHADLQAMARAHRIGQTKQVSIYRFVIKSSVEEKIIERAKRKMVLDHLVIQRMESSGKINSENGKSRLEAEDFEAILRFSAQEIFKDEKDEFENNNEENDFNLQTILKQAEVQDTGNATSAFLSSFKVISLDSMVPNEEELIEKDWNNLIPKSYIDCINDNNGDLKNLLKPDTRKSNVNHINEESTDPTLNSTKNIDSREYLISLRSKLSKLETRKLVNNMQKFGCPQKRADKILEETQLMNKMTVDELAQLMVDIIERCRVHLSLTKEGEEISVEYNTYQIPVRQFLQRIDMLEELNAVMSIYSREERLNHQFVVDTKPTCWSCSWNVKDDNHLLVGIYEQGLGSWKGIKADLRLNLHQKMLPNNPKLLPQVKHLGTRLHYLLDCLKRSSKEPIKLKIKLGGPTKSISLPESSNKQLTPKKYSSNKIKKCLKSTSKSDVSNNINNSSHCEKKQQPIKEELQYIITPTNTSKNHSSDVASDFNSTTSSESEEFQPMEFYHINQHDLDSFNDDEFMSCKGSKFKECKLLMKECRKQLETVQVILTANNEDIPLEINADILTVGDRIIRAVSEIEENRRYTYLIYLWNFVKIFCPYYSAYDLYQMYRKSIDHWEIQQYYINLS